MMDLDRAVHAMMHAAKRAGAGLLEDYARVDSLTIAQKAGMGDLMSTADLRAEETIRQVLQAHIPGYSFLCEEGGWERGARSAACWIVDPLDGTMNFLRRIPLFGVNLALEWHGEIVAAVTYMPVNNEMFRAIKGGGAYLNDTRICVSTRSGLRNATVSIGIPFIGKKFHTEFHREVAALTPNVAQIRRLGSCAMEMAYVACGRLDAYWERDVRPWDIAAGILLVREAGGHVSDAAGAAATPAAGSVLVAVPGIAGELLEILRGAAEPGTQRSRAPEAESELGKA